MKGQSRPQNVSDETGKPHQHRRLRSITLRRTLFLLALVVGIVLGAIGWAAATGDSTTPQPSASAAPRDTNHPSHWGGPWGGGWGGAVFDRARALHGEVVLATDGDGTETVVIQRGALTALTATSIAVTSSDGFQQTYVTNDDTRVHGGETIRSLARGTGVLVSGRKTGSTLTAMHIVHLAD